MTDHIDLLRGYVRPTWATFHAGGVAVQRIDYPAVTMRIFPGGVREWGADLERRLASLEKRAGVVHMRRDAELRRIWRGVIERFRAYKRELITQTLAGHR